MNLQKLGTNQLYFSIDNEDLLDVILFLKTNEKYKI